MQSLLQEEQGRNADMNKALDSMRAQLESLGKAQQDQAMSLSTSAGKLDDLDQKLEQSLQKVEDVRSDIEHKGERMENLLDLIDTVKRDLNDDSVEWSMDFDMPAIPVFVCSAVPPVKPQKLFASTQAAQYEAIRPKRIA